MRLSGQEFCNLHLDDIVGVVGTLKALEPGSHLTANDNGGRSVVVDGLAHGRVERVEVLTLALPDLEAVTAEGLGHVEAWQVVKRVAAVGRIHKSASQSKIDDSKRKMRTQW